MSEQKTEMGLLLTLAAVQFTHIMDFMIMMPLGPQLMRLFAIEPAQFSLLVSAYTFSAGATGFLSSFIIDRFDRKSALAWAYTGFIIGTFACAFAPSYYWLLTARLFTGAFGGVLGAQILSIVGDSIPYSRRGRAMGIVMTSFSIASVFGVPFGLYLATLSSWHAPFVFLGFVGTALLLAIRKFVPQMRGHIVNPADRENPLMLLRHILRTGNQTRALLLTAVLMFGHFTLIPFLSPYMVSNVGFTESQLMYIYLLGGAATIFTSPLVGRITDRTGSARVFTWAAIVALIPIWIITHLGPTPVPLVLLATTAFFVVANARMVPAMNLVSATVQPQRRGGFMSINSSVQQMFAGFASFTAGLLVVRGPGGELLRYNYVCYLTIVASLVCIWIARHVKPLSSETRGSAT